MVTVYQVVYDDRDSVFKIKSLSGKFVESYDHHDPTERRRYFRTREGKAIYEGDLLSSIGSAIRYAKDWRAYALERKEAEYSKTLKRLQELEISPYKDVTDFEPETIERVKKKRYEELAILREALEFAESDIEKCKSTPILFGAENCELCQRSMEVGYRVSFEEDTKLFSIEEIRGKWEFWLPGTYDEPDIPRNY